MLRSLPKTKSGLNLSALSYRKFENLTAYSAYETKPFRYFSSLEDKDALDQDESPLTPKLIPTQPSKDFGDFIGNNVLIIHPGDFEKADQLASALAKDYSYQELWDSIFEKDSNQLARAASLAFKRGKITREQTATLLQLRQIEAIACAWEQKPLGSSFEEASMLRFFLPSTLEQNNFDVQRKPFSEHSYFKITLDCSTIADARILRLLHLGYNTKVIYFDQEQLDNLDRHLNPPYSPQSRYLSFSILSTGAMDAVTQARYGKDAKKLLPRLGKFTINDIERGIQNKARYAAFSHPDIPDSGQFHGLEAPAFYMSLHDELHRQLISAIPNKAYEAYLEAIKLIREKTGIHWSKELWNGIDMEINTFLDLTLDDRNAELEPNITAWFQNLLSAHIASSDEYMGLFDAELSFLDTTFILMIDLYENSKKWENLGINSDYFNVANQELYNFVEFHWNLIRNKPAANQVAILKKLYMDGTQVISSISQLSASFHKAEGNYLQVKIDNKIVGQSKAHYIALRQYEANYQNLEIELNALNITTQPKEVHERAKAVATAIAEEMRFASPIHEDLQAKSRFGFFYKAKQPSLAKIHFYIKSLELTRRLLNPMNQNDKALRAEYQKLIEEGKPDISTMVLGAMISFIGLTTIALNLFVTAASFGLASPLTLAGLSLGAGTTAYGIRLFKNGLCRTAPSAAMLNYERTIQGRPAPQL